MFFLWREMFGPHPGKVNSDFGTACKGLNTAASILSRKWKFTKILLVVNVFGANQNTRAQRTLEWPYILIRDKDEAKAYYSVNFADLIWYARDSHLLKHSKKGEPDNNNRNLKFES